LVPWVLLSLSFLASHSEAVAPIHAGLCTDDGESQS
jgi:hypothetical protein